MIPVPVPPQVLEQVARGLLGGAQPPAGAPPLLGADALAALIATAASAQQHRFVSPAEEPARTPELRLPSTVTWVAAGVIVGFFLTLVGVVGLLLVQPDLHGSLLAVFTVLAVGFGVIASKFGTVVDFLFGSSWGSRQKDVWKSSVEDASKGDRKLPPLRLPPPAEEDIPPRSLAIPGVGHSTDPSTAAKRMDVPKELGPASIRYNNPGAQWPSADAARFGQIGFGQLSDGQGNKIARFPHPVNGAAANFDLLRRKYVGMTMGAAGRKWTGANSFGVPGYPDDAVLTADLIDDPAAAIPLMQAIARREAGRESPLTEAEWAAAHAMFRAGSADAYLASLGGEAAPRRPTGAAVVALARTRVGEKYVNVLVPKNDPNWHGPWDCAEFASWLVYQVAGILYGCTDDSDDPARADAYTGAWRTDASTKGKMISVAEAASTPGAFLLRYPPAPGEMGHIAVSDGVGGTVEAAGSASGVVAGKVAGRRWDTGVLVPGIDYSTGPAVAAGGPEKIYGVGQPNMSSDKVREIQSALIAKGFSPGDADGEYGQNTTLAVVAFQQAAGLVPDGEVGPLTAAALGLTL